MLLILNSTLSCAMSASLKNAKWCLVGNNEYESNREEERQPALTFLCYKILIRKKVPLRILKLDSLSVSLMKDRAFFKTNVALLCPQLWCLTQQFFLENKSLRQKIKQMPWTSDWHIPYRGIFTWENCSTNISSIWDIFQLSCLAILFPPHSLRCTVEKQRHLTSTLDWECWECFRC